MDVCSWGNRDPLRLEFEGEHLHSIRRFSAFDQRSIELMDRAWCVPPFRRAQAAPAWRPIFLMTTCLLTHEQPWTRSSPAHLVGGFDVDQPSGARGEIVALGGSASTEHLKGNWEAVERTANAGVRRVGKYGACAVMKANASG